MGHYKGTLGDDDDGLTGRGDGCSNVLTGNECGYVGSINNGIRLVADAHGVAAGVATDAFVQLDGDNSVLGRSVIVHGQYVVCVCVCFPRGVRMHF